ncbi:NAD(P)H-binding protein [Devosia sp. A8/3-2]|nr:NAD(P)H-binding protein [Devosia sp. A8/3-2]
MADFKNSTLLVTGASGQFRRSAVEELLARGATKIIAGTRNPAKLADLAARGVEVRRLDFDDKASLAAGFAGVERVLLISTDAVGSRVAQQKNAVEAAKAAGVKHVVYTSAPNPRPNPGTGVSPSITGPRWPLPLPGSISPSCAITSMPKSACSAPLRPSARASFMTRPMAAAAPM